MAHILTDPQQHQCAACGQPLPRFTTEPPTPDGWICPSCGRCYAPWVPECRHCPDRDGPVTPPDPPPYEPVPGAIRWGEDPWHSPSRPRRLSCRLIFWRPCIHQGDG